MVKDLSECRSAGAGHERGGARRRMRRRGTCSCSVDIDLGTVPSGHLITGGGEGEEEEKERDNTLELLNAVNHDSAVFLRE